MAGFLTSANILYAKPASDCASQPLCKDKLSIRAVVLKPGAEKDEAERLGYDPVIMLPEWVTAFL